ncbi:MAG: transglycosylase SLT domain-containing protein [Candidatus Micrarchaeia archaeon]|jgi:hypothetical protein
MPMRGLGASGYYREPREGGRRGGDERAAASGARRTRLMIAAVILGMGALLVLNASNETAPGGARATLSPSETWGQANETLPDGPSEIPVTPRPPKTVTPKPNVSPGASGGQDGNPTPIVLNRGFLLNTTTGPYDLAVGETVLSVGKRVLVTGDNYTESLDVRNVGGKSVDFNIVDVIPKSFGMSVWDASFAENFDALSSRIARFPYSLYPGESVTHGPTTLPIGNTTDTVQNLITEASHPLEESPLLDEEWLANHPLALSPEVVQQAQQYINEIGLQDWAPNDLRVISQEISDFHTSSNGIASQLGLPTGPGADGTFSCNRAKPLNYSKLKIIDLLISEQTQKTRFSLPLDNFSADSGNLPTFLFEGRIKDVMSVWYQIDKCSMNFTLNFSQNLVECGRYPFDTVTGNFRIYFPKTRKTFAIPVVVTVAHEDLSGGEEILLTDCGAANKIISTAVGMIGQNPGDFGCPSPGCACFASVVFKRAGASFGHSAWAPAVFDMAKAKGKVINTFAELRPGDLVFYTGTYGSFPPGTITHVEIFLGGKYGSSATIGSGDRPVGISKAGLKGYFHKGVRLVKCEDASGTESADAEITPTQEVVPEQKQCVSPSGAGAGIGTAGGTSGGEGSAGSAACYIDLVRDIGKKKGLDPCLLLAIMKTESGCNKDSVGGDGECGLMQVMPQWFQNHAGWGSGNGVLPYNYYSSPNYGDPQSCYIPANNIDAGAEVFKRAWNGDKTTSLCAYNTGSASSGCPYATKVLGNYNANC